MEHINKLSCAFLLLCMTLSGCEMRVHQRNTICHEDNILCYLYDALWSKIIVYCDGTYTWEIERLSASGDLERHSFKGFIPNEHFMQIKNSVLQSKQFDWSSGIPIYVNNSTDSFSSLPRGVGELMGFIWQRHITPLHDPKENLMNGK